MEETLKIQFEQIFVKHYERLANSKQSVGGLPFSMENIVCFILFGGRELDIEDVYGDVSERYSLSTFLADAKEAGIQDEEQLQKAIHNLITQKFIHEQPDGHYYSYQATRDTARMLNRIYPKMTGLSMLAYIGQTIQEVESGRVDLESALSRFDQTLQKQGVPLPKPKIPVITPTPAKPVVAPKKAEEIKHSSSKIFRDYVVTPSTRAKTENQDTVVVEPAVEAPQQADTAATLDLSKPAVEIEPTIVVAPPSVRVEEPLPAPPPEPQIKEAVVVNDDEIAAKIAAFEKELALTCPVCKTNILKEEKTAAGKIFYSCTSDKCNFISWGRPHQIPCVRCKNPFLVEVTDNDGRMFLKCPRATCQHRQLPPPAGQTPGPASGGGTVVRKRLVRRKI